MTAPAFVVQTAVKGWQLHCLNKVHRKFMGLGGEVISCCVAGLGWAGLGQDMQKCLKSQQDKIHENSQEAPNSAQEIPRQMPDVTCEIPSTEGSLKTFLR